MNKVILIGRLCNEPEVKYVGANKVAITKFTIAINRTYKNSRGEYDVDFIDCDLWEKQAETFCKYITKGKLIAIEGQLRLDEYISSAGENVKKVKVRCSRFDFLSNKPKNNDNIVNTKSIFENEECFDSNISECEIPF